ncbi:MAG: disulfide bond formation protein DsbA [Legionella sp.]|nr:MAG: disulfide bond formation protein DsbA [Legionella sp.]PJE00182.1 MAG: disulfide bond formation protein DsbA [Legionella sp.]
MLKKILALLLLLPALSFAAEFIEGKDYQLVNGPSLERNKAPVIMEFFSYGCPWCYKIEAPLAQWLASSQNKVTLERVPVVFKPDWELYAKAYYTAKTLAMLNKMEPALFKAIQEEHKPLNTNQAMIHFFTTQGLDREIASSAFEHSSTIDLQVKEGMNLMALYSIHAVPAFVINNKYKTDLQMAENPERLLEIMNFLLKKPA